MLAEFVDSQMTEEKREMFLNTMPLRGFSQPLGIAKAALFPTSDEASLIFGICMEVDGGRCI